MAKLTREQIHFLLSQKILPSSLFDATGMKARDWQAAMKAEEKSFAFGTTPCKEAGHTLRTRRGHCIQCDHSKIAFQRRNGEAGTVYLAGSPSKKLIKVGVSKDYQERVERMSADGYGGASDWVALAVLPVEKAGNVEFDTHHLLSAYAHPVTYVRDGRSTDCRELFACSYKTASEAMAIAAQGNPPRPLMPEDRLSIVYGFPDIQSAGVG